MTVAILEPPARTPVVRSNLFVSATKRKSDGVDPFELIRNVGAALRLEVTPFKTSDDGPEGLSVRLWDDQNAALFRFIGDRWIVAVHDYENEDLRWPDLWRAATILGPWAACILGNWHVKMDYNASDAEVDTQVCNMDWCHDGELVAAVKKSCPKKYQD